MQIVAFLCAKGTISNPEDSGARCMRVARNVCGTDGLLAQCAGPWVGERMLAAQRADLTQGMPPKGIAAGVVDRALQLWTSAAADRAAAPKSPQPRQS